MRPNLQPLQSATKSTVALAIGLLCMSTGGGNAFAASPENDAVRSVEQAKTTIKGIVLDENGDPVIGASVVDASGKNGTVTDANGNFSLEAPKGTTLNISYLGYNSKTITASGTAVRVVLEPSNHELNEVVVTALGIKREKKALGYAMQEVKTDGLTENKNFSVANMLQGKVAGVQISQSGTGLGGSTRIVMRGLNSLSGNNQPLWVVDGMPISDNSSEQASQWGGFDYAVTPLSASRQGKKLTVKIGARHGNYLSMPTRRKYQVMVIASVVPEEVLVNKRKTAFHYDGMTLSLIVDLGSTNCANENTVEITYPSTDQCISNGEIGQMRRVRENVYQLKVRNANIVLTDDLANMESAGRAITYNPSLFTQKMNFFHDRFAHLEEVLQAQKLSDADYKFFNDNTY
jgi:hypothetical protein